MSTVTIKVTCRMGQKEIEVPGVTTTAYAAKRCADAFNLDDEKFWGLATTEHPQTLLPLEDCICEHEDVGLLELVPLEYKGE